MERTNKPTTAGILNIITGALGIIWAIMMFIGYCVVSGTCAVPGGIGYIPEFVPGMILGWAVIQLILSVLVLVGGIYALRRKIWGLALAGSIVAILLFFPLGIPATVFAVQAKDEFEQAQ